MSAHVGISSGSTMLADDTPRLTACSFSTNSRGCEALTYHVPLPLTDAFRRYDWPGTPQAILRADGAVPFLGRVEDVAIRGDGIDMTALGYSRAFADFPYTAFWSDDSLERWRILTSDDLVNTNNTKHIFDQQNRLYMSLQKGTTYNNNVDFAVWGYQRPSGSSRSIIGIQCDLEMTLPLNWTFVLHRLNDNWGFIANVITAGASGALQKFSYSTTFAGAGALIFAMYNTTGAPVAFAGENGTNYAKITNLRIVTTTTNRVNTTLTANRAAGANVTATVGTTARMYVGQKLVIDSGNFGSETVTILSIGSSTQFNATFVNNHVIGNPVQAHVVYADEIATDLLATVNSTNAGQLSTSTALIQSPGLDLTNEVYDDLLPADILDYLTGLGDNQATPRQWEWRVGVDQVLVFGPQSSGGQTWYVDITALELQRTLEQIQNSAYATYQDASGRTIRTATATDSASLTRTGITRRQAVSASTTSSVQSGVVRDAALADGKNPPPRFGITFEAIYNSNGGRVPLWLPKAGDTAVIRNLPPNISVAIDQIRTFRIARTECDLIAGTLTLEPQTPLPRVASILARVNAGVNAQTGALKNSSTPIKTRVPS